MTELDLTITFHHFSHCLTLISHNPNEIMLFSGFLLKITSKISWHYIDMKGVGRAVCEGQYTGVKESRFLGK